MTRASDQGGQCELRNTINQTFAQGLGTYPYLGHPWWQEDRRPWNHQTRPHQSMVRSRSWSLGWLTPLTSTRNQTGWLQARRIDKTRGVAVGAQSAALESMLSWTERVKMGPHSVAAMPYVCDEDEAGEGIVRHIKAKWVHSSGAWTTIAGRWPCSLYHAGPSHTTTWRQAETPQHGH